MDQEFKFKYSSFTRAKTHIKYHIVFSTKYRRKCLEQIKEQTLNIFKRIGEESSFKILEMNLDKDHIHFLIEGKPSCSIEQIIRKLKQSSIKYLYDDQEVMSYLKKFYWKNKKTLWSRGYFCSTVGLASEKIILKYIKNQRKNK